MSPANSILRAILIEQFRIGAVLNRVKDAYDDGKELEEKESQLIRDHLGRLDGLVYALTVTAPNYRALCEAAGIPAHEIDESLDRIGPDFDVPEGFAGKVSQYRHENPEGGDEEQ